MGILFFCFVLFCIGNMIVLEQNNRFGEVDELSLWILKVAYKF